MTAQSNEARQAILDSIRARLAESKSLTGERVNEPHRASAVRVTGSDDKASRAAWFQQMLESVGGKTVRVSSDEQAAEIIDQIIDKSAARRVAMSDAAIVARISAMIKSDVDRVESTVKSSELLNCDIGITSAQWAIAETGTLVMESHRERHRLISLVPPIHIAVIESSQICASLDEALLLVRGEGEAGLSRAVTFITGPSRTGDIEMVLTIGVHGPQQLHVIIID